MPKVVLLVKETYLAVIKNSVGSRMFQNFYATVDDMKKDIMNGGGLSCAFFVSSITMLTGLSKNLHGTVDGTVRDLNESGWGEISDLRIGAVIIWEKEIFDGEEHKHIGFYIGNNEAISNSSLKKVPVQHNATFDGKRKIANILWNSKLD